MLLNFRDKNKRTSIKSEKNRSIKFLHGIAVL
ncbi:hypothetical protein LSS_22725 [Leptospira santarosai serovar Shermani str. LT 821]|uniref:Uncharacterized protein n=1 Tax=Leptospira santarosai serovar Shermani str. LT 821 TaxID=758847 RepID=A0A097ESW4_9LEPT|nr:hypothetical protein LSS_22725 [Leptospira santarosai serovar Shermani str. LT 821]